MKKTARQPFKVSAFGSYPSRAELILADDPQFITSIFGGFWSAFIVGLEEPRANVIGHGLFGSELYLRARHCHLGVAGSLLFTSAASATWEYGFEANGVRPSGFDLWFTPLSGLVLGEGRYWAWRAAGSVGQKTLRGVLRAVLDPFGELERAAGTRC